MPPSKLSHSERMRRKREAARLRQQRCRARKRNAMMMQEGETEPTVTKRNRNCKQNKITSFPDLSEIRTSPDPPEISAKTTKSPLASKTSCSFRQDLPTLPTCLRGVSSFMETTPIPNTPVFVPKLIVNKPGSERSAFFSPQSITRNSSPKSPVQKMIQHHKQGTLIPMLHWKPTSTEFLAPVPTPAPRLRSPTDFDSSQSNMSLSPRIKTVHTFDENELTAVDAMLSLRYSPVSVTSSPSRMGLSIKNIGTYDNKPFIPLFRPSEVPRDTERQRMNFIVQDVNLKPGLHMYYN